MKRAAILISLVAVAAVLTTAIPGSACTSIMVGKNASSDGSVMTSHTCDSHRTGSAIVVVPAATHAAGTEITLTKRTKDDTGPMERYGREITGTMPQIGSTYGYLNPSYASMNEHQLAIGESTFGGPEELVSPDGLIDCETLTRLMLERATTAREAITIGGELIEKHGWLDEGEALTIADPNEVWLMEIVGPGPDTIGAVWAARRIPDDHISVIANSARIAEVDTFRDDTMASSNVTAVAEELGLWDPASDGPFRFCEAYNPDGNFSFASSRRIWRVFNLLAPSQKLNGNGNVFPLSVKPDEGVSPLDVMEVFRDTYEGTEYDTVKNLTFTDDEGVTSKSPLANPFMPYEMLSLFDINGGWGELGERHLARWYAMYVTVTQSRSSLPNPVGGVVWFAYSNPAMATYVPLYAGITDLPSDYETDGRTTGYSRDSAWWAFNRLATLAAQRWGDMREDVAEVRDPLQEKYFAMQTEVAERAAELLSTDPAAARSYLTGISRAACEEATEAYWRLGDGLWTKYDEKW